MRTNDPLASTFDDEVVWLVSVPPTIWLRQIFFFDANTNFASQWGILERILSRLIVIRLLKWIYSQMQFTLIRRFQYWLEKPQFTVMIISFNKKYKKNDWQRKKMKKNCPWSNETSFDCFHRQKTRTFHQKISVSINCNRIVVDGLVSTNDWMFVENVYWRGRREMDSSLNWRSLTRRPPWQRVLTHRNHRRRRPCRE